MLGEVLQKRKTPSKITKTSHANIQSHSIIKKQTRQHEQPDGIEVGASPVTEVTEAISTFTGV
jgi:hypothetical protein